MKKTHIAMINVPAYGHINPTLAVISELVKRDYRVTYPVIEEFIPAVKATGASVLLYQSSSSWDKLEDYDIHEIFNTKAEELPLMMLDNAISSYYQMEQWYQDDLPDLILYDFVALAGKLFAAKHGIDAVRLCSSYAQNEKVSAMPTFSEETMSKLASKLQEFLDKEAISGFSIQELMEPEQLNIAFLPRAFQPGGDQFDDNFHFVGPSIGKRNYQESLPIDTSNDRPVMLISLGTIFNPWPEFYKMCMEAFGGSEWQVVMSIGKKISPETLGEIPSNFIVRQQVPQLEILPYTKVFITHGGMNSTMEALNNGVPMVVVPQMFEQEITARRVTELGLGRHFLRDEVTVQALRESVEQVAGDGQLKQRVLDMRKNIQEAGGAEKAVDVIETFLNASNRQHTYSAH